MARPIKETPILFGKDARRFEKTLKENENKKVSSADYQRAIDIYRKVVSKTGSSR